ncbi:hypothetical protein V6Z11_A05G418100 [Gossypium hirsutum]
MWFSFKSTDLLAWMKEALDNQLRMHIWIPEQLSYYQEMEFVAMTCEEKQRSLPYSLPPVKAFWHILLSR